MHHFGFPDMVQKGGHLTPIMPYDPPLDPSVAALILQVINVLCDKGSGHAMHTRYCFCTATANGS